MVEPIVDLLKQLDIGIVQLPCPEMAHFGLGRPIGEDTREQYDVLQYRETCSSLADRLVSEASDYLRNGYEVACILGVEGSPSCSVHSAPTRSGTIPGSGIFFEILVEKLRGANLGIPVIGVPEIGDLSATLAEIQQYCSV